MKHRKISEKIYQRLRSAGSHAERLYGLAKVQTKDMAVRPVFSTPDSSCQKKTDFRHHFSYTFNRNTFILTRERNRFVKLKLLPIFKTNVFDLFAHRQVKGVGNKLLKDKMNIYLQLSETTLKTILGSILKNSINNFTLHTIFSLFTTVVNHRTNV